MFETFVNRARAQEGRKDKFEHEEMSQALLELLLKRNKISMER
jgi:hypothetical protein